MIPFGQEAEYYEQVNEIANIFDQTAVDAGYEADVETDNEDDAYVPVQTIRLVEPVQRAPSPSLPLAQSFVPQLEMHRSEAEIIDGSNDAYWSESESADDFSDGADTQGTNEGLESDGEKGKGLFRLSVISAGTSSSSGRYTAVTDSD